MADKIKLDISEDRGDKAKRMARQVVGPVKPGHVIVPKQMRKKPKHKKPIDAGE